MPVFLLLSLQRSLVRGPKEELEVVLFEVVEFPLVVSSLGSVNFDDALHIVDAALQVGDCVVVEAAEAEFLRVSLLRQNVLDFSFGIFLLLAEESDRVCNVVLLQVDFGGIAEVK